MAQAVDNKGKVTYSLKSGGDSGLSIDPVTGKVTLSGVADYETKASYTFTVVATDPSGNASEQTVTVNVTNTDERGPTITSASTAATVAENSGAGRVVYTAAATDADFVAPATANSVTYSLKAGSDAGLSINPQTGQVTLTGNPDYETKSSYSFTVVATDAAGNAAEKAVTFSIANADEVGPTITSASTAANVAENSGAGQAVYTATGADVDFIAPATANSISWSLKPGADAAAFSINAQTGVVTLLGDPDYEAKGSYSFTVIGTDAAGNATEKAVTFSIGNIDDTAPAFGENSTSFDYSENQSAGATVATVTGFTDDVGVTEYRFSDSGGTSGGTTTGDGWFTIGSSGAITMTGSGAASQANDYEAGSAQSYGYYVQARDAAGNWSTPVAVTLNVSDVQEVDLIAPVYGSGVLSFAYEENQSAGTSLGTVTGFTDGFGVTDFRFAVTGTNLSADGFYTISSAGVVSLTAAGAGAAASNDYELTPNIFTYGIEAGDAAGHWSTAKDITLTVTDAFEPAQVALSPAPSIVFYSGSSAMFFGNVRWCRFLGQDAKLIPT